MQFNAMVSTHTMSMKRLLMAIFIADCKRLPGLLIQSNNGTWSLDELHDKTLDGVHSPSVLFCVILALLLNRNSTWLSYQVLPAVCVIWKLSLNCCLLTSKFTGKTRVGAIMALCCAMMHIIGDTSDNPRSQTCLDNTLTAELCWY